jgi:hypothetical protein
MSGPIFISYRRDDAPHLAGRLYDRLAGVLPTVVSPGAIWDQVEPGLESEALLANSVKHGWSESTELLITVKNWDSRD